MLTAEEQNKKLVTIIKVLGVLIIFMFLFMVGYSILHKSHDADATALVAEIKKLQIQLDTLKQTRIKLDTAIAQYSKDIDKLSKKDSDLAVIQKGFNDKIILNNKQYEKISRVDTFGSNSIKQFFTDEFK